MADLTPDEFFSLRSQTREAYRILVDELKKRSVKFDSVEAIVYPDLKTVGIKGDRRVYAYPIFISVNMPDGRLYLDYDFLESVSTRICNVAEDITRVLYRISTNENP